MKKKSVQLELTTITFGVPEHILDKIFDSIKEENPEEFMRVFVKRVKSYKRKKGIK